MAQDKVIKNIRNRPKPIMLMILDGWGINEAFGGNAITLAKTPVIDSLISEYPVMALRASGEAVGLPWGEAGNSEVGHLSIGLGRILYQDLSRINKSINDKSIYHNEVLLGAIEHVNKNNSNLHFMGVVSDGCVHASIDHLFVLLKFAKENNIKRVYIHAILDGRDTSYNSGIKFIKRAENSISKFSVGKIATISGRFYAMDRNNNWDRTEKAYRAMTEGEGNKSISAVEAIELSYKKEIFDEEFIPTIITKNGEPETVISDNDAVIFYNFRPDRARQITKAFVAPDFDKFNRPRRLENLYFATFTQYEKGLPVHVVFPPEEIKNSLGQIISDNNLKQLRIAETEKYAHVTYFFNGGKSDKFKNEDHILIPSKPVANYAEIPEMSALEITKKLTEEIERDFYDFIVVNYANADMVGHTGNLKAGIKAVEFIDKCVGTIVQSIMKKNGILLITADHGNAEVMFNMQTGQIDKEHTTNPVPLIIINKNFAGRNIGWQNVSGGDLSTIQAQGILADVAPTILTLMKIPKPDEMTGVSLI